MGAYDLISSDNRRKVDQLLADTVANNGLAPLDLDGFWLDQAAARKDPFGPSISQIPLGAICDCEFIIPQDWDIHKAIGCKVPVFRWLRGPCTFATSIYGSENLMFLLCDDPGLFARFSDVIGRAILGIARVACAC